MDIDLHTACLAVLNKTSVTLGEFRTERHYILYKDQHMGYHSPVRKAFYLIPTHKNLEFLPNITDSTCHLAVSDLYKLNPQWT